VPEAGLEEGRGLRLRRLELALVLAVAENKGSDWVRFAVCLVAGSGPDASGREFAEILAYDVAGPLE